MTYQEYLESDRWAKLRAAVIARDGFKCRCCNTQHGLQVHHCEYPEDFSNDSPKNCITLCRTHHKNRHGIEQFTRIDRVTPTAIKQMGIEL